MHTLLLYTTIFLLSAVYNVPERQATSDKPNQITESQPLQALIVDGQNNHGDWPMTTHMMKTYLESTGLFEVDVARTKYVWIGPHGAYTKAPEDKISMLEKYSLVGGGATVMIDSAVHDPDYNPDFSKYDVVISNFGWLAADWPKKTQKALHKYVNKGGGLVIVHAANNCFGDWDQYNEMIGLGGWGGRDTESGPYVYYNTEGDLIRDPSEGRCGSHGPQQEFQVITRAPDHPIMKGLPRRVDAH